MLEKFRRRFFREVIVVVFGGGTNPELRTKWDGFGNGPEGETNGKTCDFVEVKTDMAIQSSLTL